MSSAHNNVTDSPLTHHSSLSASRSGSHCPPSGGGAPYREHSQSIHHNTSSSHSPPKIGASPTVPSVKGVCPAGLPTSEAYTVQCSTECLREHIVPGLWLDEMALITNGRAVGETIRLCGPSSVYIRFKENQTGYPLAFSLPKHVLVPYCTTACSAVASSTRVGGYSKSDPRQDGLGLPDHHPHHHHMNRIGVSPTSAFASSHDMHTMLMSHSINHHNRREGLGSLSPIPNLNGISGNISSSHKHNGRAPLAASVDSVRADGITEGSKCVHYAAMHASKDHHDHVEVHEGLVSDAPLLCVVCGCWGKKTGQQRTSGYKCRTCVGKASLPRLRYEFQRLLKQGKVECST